MTHFPGARNEAARRGKSPSGTKPSVINASTDLRPVDAFLDLACPDLSAGDLASIDPNVEATRSEDSRTQTLGERRAVFARIGKENHRMPSNHCLPEPDQLPPPHADAEPDDQIHQRDQEADAPPIGLAHIAGAEEYRAPSRCRSG